MQPAFFQFFLQQRQRLHCQLIVLCQCRNKAVSAVRAEPDSIAGKEMFPVHKVYHVPPCMTGNEKALDSDPVDVDDLIVVQQHFFIVDRHLRQLVKVVNDPAAHLAGQIAVLDLANIQRSIPKQSRTVRLHRTYMVGVLMSDEDVPDGLRVTINNEKVLLHDGETFEIDGIKIECFLVPGHTWGHMVYLIDDKYLFTGDTLWFGADGGYSFISSLAESNKLAVKSLAALEQKLQSRGLHPLFLTGHTGWTDNLEFAFAHKDKLCSPFRKRVPDPTAPYDAYDESDDTEKMAKSGFLKGVGR